MAHPDRATLTRALHAGSAAEFDFHLREAEPGDRYLLCTDGVHAVLGDEQVHEVLGAGEGPADTVRELTALVHRAGAPDNLTCVVTDVPAA